MRSGNVEVRKWNCHETPQSADCDEMRQTLVNKYVAFVTSQLLSSSGSRLNSCNVYIPQRGTLDRAGSPERVISWSRESKIIVRWGSDEAILATHNHKRAWHWWRSQNLSTLWSLLESVDSVVWCLYLCTLDDWFNHNCNTWQSYCTLLCHLCIGKCSA